MSKKPDINILICSPGERHEDCIPDYFIPLSEENLKKVGRNILRNYGFDVAAHKDDKDDEDNEEKDLDMRSADSQLSEDESEHSEGESEHSEEQSQPSSGEYYIFVLIP